MGILDPWVAGAGSRQVQAQPWLVRAIGEGRSFNATQKFLQEQGLGYRRSVMLQDYREQVGYAKGMPSLLSTPGDTVLGGKVAWETPYNRSKTWTYTGGASSFDPETGETGVQNQTWSVDTPKTADEVKAHFMENLQGEQYDPSRMQYGDSWVGSAEWRKPRVWR